MTSVGPTLLGPADVRALAARLGRAPHQAAGSELRDRRQHRTAHRPRAAREPDDVVVEVGPGLGSLTLGAARRGPPGRGDRGRTRCWPPRCRRRSRRTPPTWPDAARSWAPTRCASTRMPGRRRPCVVANLPYNVSVPVLLHLLALLPGLERGLVMVQSEVADRLAAHRAPRCTASQRQGRRGTPTSAARARSGATSSGRPQRRLRSRCLDPTRPPRRPPPPASRCSRSSTRRSPIAARCCAAHCAPWPGRAEAAERALAQAGVDPMARGESLGIEAFARIAEALDERDLTVRSGGQDQPACSASEPRVRTGSTPWSPSTRR
jgi:16S rRNA (adenine1518-N6/adenine1519-N6)-dimethyltransferase